MENPQPSWVLSFQISELKCALPLDQIGELLPMAQLSAVPMMPPFVEGILNLAGQEIPVLRLDRLLELPEQTLGINSVLVILRSAEPTVALVVDAVDDAKQVTKDTQVVPFNDERCFKRCFLADLRFAETTHHLISVENLLLTEERERLTNFQTREDQRLSDVKEVALVS